ncbi:MAG: hypothetical protein CSA34_02900 [Desulfobulbus propionicus]|nr:MAG: hypothetical protein CSA34_02900 [Desulfobulbus propionicus]
MTSQRRKKRTSAAVNQDPSEWHWLIFAYFFNNDGKAASQTITDRLPLLLEAGVKPTVLSGPTGKRAYAFPHHRVFSPMPSGLRYELRFIMKRWEVALWLKETLRTVVSVVLLLPYLAERMVVHLDTHWSWSISGFFRGLYCLVARRPQLLYSTAGPSSTHVAAYFLHRISGIPWIAELHDPLLYDDETRRWRQHYLFHRWLESKICRHASVVIFFTEHALNSADQRHPVIGMKMVLRPGANPPPITGMTYAVRQRFHLGHFGSLASTRSLARCVEALHRLLEMHPTLRSYFVLDIYGAVLDESTRRALARFPLDGVLREHGRLEYDAKTGKSGRQQAYEAMHLSDVLLILHGSGQVCDEYIPSKLYEYLLTGRPILGLTGKETELGGILVDNGHTVADPEEVGAITSAVLQLFQRWQAGTLDNGVKDSPFDIELSVNSLLDAARQVSRA